MSTKEESQSPVIKLIILAVVVIGLLAATKFLPVEQWLKSFNDWVSHMAVAGIFIFIAVYAAATVLLAPGLILTIGAGFAFGLWKGFLAVSAGATLGSLWRFSSPALSLATGLKRWPKETTNSARSTLPSANKARS